MPESSPVSRRGLFKVAGALTASAVAVPAGAADGNSGPGPVKRIGVISAAIRGKPQKVNGHTWHFCFALHPTINLDVVAKYLDPGTARIYKAYFRNPALNFDQIPFPDTRITHIYAADPTTATLFTHGFEGVKVAKSVEEMAGEVNAIWLGDASGHGEDHFELLAPALERGLPTFCDKPIGETVEGTRKILALAEKHKAPLMSSSLYRHQWGTAEALRMRDSKEFGSLQYLMCSQQNGWTLSNWHVYGPHPAWMVMTVCGPGVEAVSMYARESAGHALVTYPDRMPAEIWHGRTDIAGNYCSTTAYFEKKTYTWTPGIEGNYWLGHHYQVFQMQAAFRKMLFSGIEPVPHREILEVTGIIQAGSLSLKERGRLVTLAEVGV